MTIPKDTLAKLLKLNPTFNYEGARSSGYTDNEIYEYLTTNGGKAIFLNIDVPWSSKVEHIVKEYPILCYLLLFIMIVATTWIGLKIIWNLLKSIIYQLVYTCSKAIKDAQNS